MYLRKLKLPYQTAANGLEALQTFKENPLALRFILMGKSSLSTLCLLHVHSPFEVYISYHIISSHPFIHSPFPIP